MALITWVVELDLAEDGTFSTDISDYVHRWGGVTVGGRGRTADLDAAGISTLTLTLDNGDGRFSPGNAGGAYGTVFRPLKRIRVKATYNAVTYDVFYGIIKAIEVRPKTADQLVYLSCEDMMAVLAATDIRLPLMADQRPGVIISRLLDLSELGEHCDNPRFKDDTTGYDFPWGGAFNRVTTGIVLEGAAALEGVGNTIGWRYSLPHAADADFQDRRVTASTYVWAADEATVGINCTLRLADSVLAQIVTSTVALTSEPQRLEVTGTYDAAATDFYIHAFTAAGAVTYRTGAVHCVYAESAIPRDVDAGDHTIGSVSYPRTSALSAIQEIRDNDLGALFFFDGAGAAVFHDQSHRWHETRSTVSQLTIDETFVALSYTMDAADRVSEVVLDFPRWETGAAGTVVFSLYPVPRGIPGNGSITVEIDYGGGLVRDTIAPVANNDYTAVFGDGSDATGSLTVDLEDYGGAAVVVISSASASPISLTSFQLRGTPVRASSDLTPTRATPTTPPALPAVLTHSYRLQESERAVQSWADYLAERFGDEQRSRLSISIAEAFPDAPLTGYMVGILGRQIGDRITLTNDAYPWATYITAEAFYVDRIDMAVESERIVATWLLSPADVDMMIWDVSSWDSAAVWAP